MSYYGVQTIMPFLTYAEVMSISPDHAMQCQNPAAPPISDCDEFWLSNGYTDTKDRIIGRNQILTSIAVAEQLLLQVAKFHMAPTWITQEETLWPARFDGATDHRDTRSPVFYTKYGWVLAGGTEDTATFILEDAPVVYTDVDSDGVDDTATVTITAAQMATAGASQYEIAVYPIDEVGENWRIRPLTIVEDGSGNITITGRRSQFLLDTLWLSDTPVDLSVNANFMDTVDIRRRWNNPETQADIVWKPSSTNVSTSDITAMGETTQTAGLVVEDMKLGGVRALPGTYAAGAWTYDAWTLSGVPSMVRPVYYGGYYDNIAGWMEGDNLSRGVAEAIVRLANSLTPDNIGGCGLTQRKWKEDRFPFDERLRTEIGQACMDAFGITTQGAAYAMRTIQGLQQAWVS